MSIDILEAKKCVEDVSNAITSYASDTATVKITNNVGQAWAKNYTEELAMSALIQQPREFGPLKINLAIYINMLFDGKCITLQTAYAIKGVDVVKLSPVQAACLTVASSYINVINDTRHYGTEISFNYKDDNRDYSIDLNNFLSTRIDFLVGANLTRPSIQDWIYIFDAAMGTGLIKPDVNNGLETGKDFIDQVDLSLTRYLSLHKFEDVYDGWCGPNTMKYMPYILCKMYAICRIESIYNRFNLSVVK